MRCWIWWKAVPQFQTDPLGLRQRYKPAAASKSRPRQVSPASCQYVSLSTPLCTVCRCQSPVVSTSGWRRRACRSGPMPDWRAERIDTRARDLRTRGRRRAAKSFGLPTTEQPFSPIPRKAPSMRSRATGRESSTRRRRAGGFTASPTSQRVRSLFLRVRRSGEPVRQRHAHGCSAHRNSVPAIGSAGLKRRSIAWNGLFCPDADVFMLMAPFHDSETLL
jgi:hypothetical protein